MSVEPPRLRSRPARVRLVELLYSRGCPASNDAHELLRSILLEHGIDALLALREVRTQADAIELHLPGSPTIRVDGRDVDPASANAEPGLGRRAYPRADGGTAPLPSRRQLEEALLSA